MFASATQETHISVVWSSGSSEEASSAECTGVGAWKLVGRGPGTMSAAACSSINVCDAALPMLGYARLCLAMPLLCALMAVLACLASSSFSCSSQPTSLPSHSCQIAQHTTGSSTGTWGTPGPQLALLALLGESCIAFSPLTFPDFCQSCSADCDCTPALHQDFLDMNYSFAFRGSLCF